MPRPMRALGGPKILATVHRIYKPPGMQLTIGGNRVRCKVQQRWFGEQATLEKLHRKGGLREWSNRSVCVCVWGGVECVQDQLERESVLRKKIEKVGAVTWQREGLKCV